jgi:beta-glucosidase
MLAPRLLAGSVGMPAPFRPTSSGLRDAAYQIEGGVKEDGRGATNWDVFSHTPGKSRAVIPAMSPATAITAMPRISACSRRWGQGLSLFRGLVAHLSRGEGKPNAKGLDYYNRLIDGLLAAGITRT